MAPTVLAATVPMAAAPTDAAAAAASGAPAGATVWLVGPEGAAKALEETLRSLDDLIGDGSIRYLGASNFAAFQLAMACGASERCGYVRPAASQFRYNLLARDAENEMLPACCALGVGGIAYNPLGGGLLACAPAQRGSESRLSSNERYRSLYLNPRNLHLRTALAAAAGAGGASLHEWALRWPLGAKGCDAVLVGATSQAQLAVALATPALPLPAELRDRIDSIVRDAADLSSHDSQSHPSQSHTTPSQDT